MKRLIAAKRLKHRCSYCNRDFGKGDVYYRNREVFEEDGKIFAGEYIICPKCKYKQEQQDLRFNEFKRKCKHPQKFIDTVWCYIPGECVKEPDYDRCMLCGQIVV